jgi:hypothetical protein
MAVVLYDEDAVQVLKSFRPYLGPQGEKVADLLDEFLKLLSSEPAQNYIITLQNCMKEWGLKFQAKISPLFRF